MLLQLPLYIHVANTYYRERGVQQSDSARQRLVAPMTSEVYTCARICLGVGIVHGPDSKAARHLPPSPSRVDQHVAVGMTTDAVWPPGPSRTYIHTGLEKLLIDAETTRSLL